MVVKEINKEQLKKLLLKEHGDLPKKMKLILDREIKSTINSEDLLDITNDLFGVDTAGEWQPEIYQYLQQTGKMQKFKETWWDKAYSKLIKLSKNKLISIAKQLKIKDKDLYEFWVLKDDIAYAIASHLEDNKNRDEIIASLFRAQ